MSLKAVLDACVLFPAPLRDTLLRAHNANTYAALFTNEILEELQRNLLKRQAALGTDAEARAQRLVSTLKERFAGSIVANYQALVESMPINPKDRHVMAAAFVNNAQIIVTHNLKDFPRRALAPYGIEPQSPDQFLLQLFYNDPQQMSMILIEQAAFLRNPPMTVFDVLNRLSLDAPNFVRIMRERFENADFR